MHFNKEFLQKECIDSFKNDGIVFTNESQFQFALAMKIKEKKPGANIYLEQPVFLKDKTTGKIIEKMYIDIVVEYNDKLYPIELKYKTANKDVIYSTDSNKTFYTFNQGAAESGSYDFIWDIKRIERLVLTNGLEDTHIKWVKGQLFKTEKDNIEFEFTTLGKDPNFACGYVIMITNNTSYYNKEQDTDLYWKNFILQNNRTIRDTLNWTNNNKDLSDYENANESEEWKKIRNGCGISRCKPIALKGEHTLKWKSYILNNVDFKGKPEFQSIIVEIERQDAPESVKITKGVKENE